MVLGAVAGALYAFPRLTEWTVSVVDWIRDAGSVGVLLYAAVYVVATLLLLPGSVLTAGAGFAYGPLLGTLLVSPVSVVAAALSFLLGRGLAREWVERKLRGKFGDGKWLAVDRAVRANGFRIVLLLRLSPVVPFNALNYLLGLTNVRFRDYVAGSFFGMLPGTFLYVYLGSALTSLSQLTDESRAKSMGEQVLFWGGLVATLVITVLLTRMARRALSGVAESSQAEGPSF